MFGAVNAEEQKLTEVSVAVCAEFKPFEYADESGNIVGIDIDIMNEICALAGLKPIYTNMEFDSLIPSVRSPLADFAISAITATEQRKKVVDFTESYLECRVYNPALDKWYEESYAIPLKLSGEYKEMLNSAIATLKENGRIDEIAASYNLTKDKDGFYTYEITLPTQNTDNSYTVSDWAKKSVDTAISNHWTSPADFSNDYTVNITREQFCEIAYNMLRDAVGVDTVNLAETSFSDTSNIKVLYLAQEGIISGKGDGTYFAPTDSLTRAEAASILYRAARYCGLSIPEYQGNPFADDAEIADWAKHTVYSVVSANIMSGTGTGFSPLGSYTAEQAVSTIERLYNSIN